MPIKLYVYCDRKTQIAEISYKCPLWISRSINIYRLWVSNTKVPEAQGAQVKQKISKTSCLRTKFGNPQY